MDLEEQDLELITVAQQAITDNYDCLKYNHTVGAAVRCQSGKIYSGVNVFSIYGACAEQIAIGCAITAGERELECIVAVRGEHGEEVLPPCGNCRQILSDYAPECKVIIKVKNRLKKVYAKELLPFAYEVEN